MENELRKEFEDKYFIQISSTKGIQSLAERIGISKNSLRRFLGKLNDNHNFRTSTLNLIAKSLGYSDYKMYQGYSEESTNLDFSTLEIFYNTVKNKGMSVTEKRFQDVNYQFAKKIILNTTNSEMFLKRFSDNKEALEYVFGWHPTYGKISDKQYQNTLLKMTRLTDVSHLNVSVYSFISFGKFLSEDWTIPIAEKDLKTIKKQLKLMRKEYGFWYFPDVRFKIVECLYAYLKSPNQVSKLVFENHPKLPKWSEQFAYNTYLADALNLMKMYEVADVLQKEISSKNHLTFYKKNEYHQGVHTLLYKISRAITLFHLNRKEESELFFQEVSNDLFEKHLPFDIKDYIEIQYYYLALKLYPKNELFNQKLKTKINQTKFTIFNTL